MQDSFEQRVKDYDAFRVTNRINIEINEQRDINDLIQFDSDRPCRLHINFARITPKQLRALGSCPGIKILSCIDGIDLSPLLENPDCGILGLYTFPSAATLRALATTTAPIVFLRTIRSKNDEHE